MLRHLSMIFLHNFITSNMKVGFGIVVFTIAVASAREFELESFTPSSNSDFNLIDYGTVRVTKIQRNQFSISGDFILKRNLGNDQTVTIYLPDLPVLDLKLFSNLCSWCLKFSHHLEPYL